MCGGLPLVELRLAPRAGDLRHEAATTEVRGEVLELRGLGATWVRTGESSPGAVILQVLNDVIIPKSLLLRRATRADECEFLELDFKHAIEVSEFGISLQAFRLGAHWVRPSLKCGHTL